MSQLLSIIIPVYNVHKYIKKSLESIDNQKVDKNQYEVVVVNDGTPDDSMVIAEPIIRRMGNAIIVNQENQGLSAARNAGLEKAKGDYVWFVDSDDFLLDNALQDVLYTINNHPDIDVIATVLQTVDEKTGKIGLEYKANYNVYSGKDYMFAGNRCGAAQRFVMRKSFLDSNQLRFVRGVYHEDGDFGNRMLYLAKTLVVLDRPVYSYLLRTSGSIMSSRKMKMNYDLVKIYKGLEEFCDKQVDKEDEWKYKAQIFDCLICTILFSRNEIDTPEFNSFYQEHRDLIHTKAGDLLKHANEISSSKIKQVLHFYFFPLFYTKFKHRAKVLISKIK